MSRITITPSEKSSFFGVFGVTKNAWIKSRVNIVLCYTKRKSVIFSLDFYIWKSLKNVLLWKTGVNKRIFRWKSVWVFRVFWPSSHKNEGIQQNRWYQKIARKKLHLLIKKRSRKNDVWLIQLFTRKPKFWRFLLSACPRVTESRFYFLFSLYPLTQYIWERRYFHIWS